MDPFAHIPWFVTAAFLAGGHIAFIGYMFIMVSEISESGWWVVFSTVLPFALLSGSSIGGLAFVLTGFPLAFVAFLFRKKWWQVLTILVLTIAALFIPKELGLWLSVPALFVFLAVHLAFVVAKGREVLRSVATGALLFAAGVGLLWFGASSGL